VNVNSANSNAENKSCSESALILSPKLLIDTTLPVNLSVCGFYQAAFSHARALEDGIKANKESENLHQYRVCLRKIRAIDSTLKVLKTEATSAKLIPDLKELMKQTNRLRDLDVYLMNSESFFQQLDKKYHPGLTRFFEDISLLREYEFQRVSEWLQSKAYQQKCREIEEQIHALSNAQDNNNIASDTFECGSQVINRRYLKVIKTASTLNTHSEDTDIHQLRIECKKLRYLLEFFAPVIHQSTYKQLMNIIKSLQESLGTYNDSSVQIAFLKSYLKQIHQTSPAYAAISRLKKQIKKRNKEARKHVLKQLSRLSRNQTIKAGGTSQRNNEQQTA